MSLGLVNVPGAARLMAGFQVSINGRFWVSTEADRRRTRMPLARCPGGRVANFDDARDHHRMVRVDSRQPANGFPSSILECGELVLRSLTLADAPEVLAAASDEATQRWILLPHPYTEGDALAYCRDYSSKLIASGRGILWAIQLGERVAGFIELKNTDWSAGSSEVGYVTAPWARNRRVMTRAVSEVARWAIEDHGLERIELRIATENVASRAVAERAGFILEGIARNAGRLRMGRVDLAIYSLITIDRLSASL
jgi:RimJ/RimL family protein N-acetyltransferase